jgi:6-phosphogluconolactonase
MNCCIFQPVRLGLGLLLGLNGAVQLGAQSPISPNEASGKRGHLMAYVGTFSSPLRDTLPTQVDLPPGNGRGIHLFEVDRTTGALTPAGTVDLGNSPSCLVVNRAGNRLYSANETDRIGSNKFGSVSAFEINPTSGQLRKLNTVDVGSQGPTYVSLHPNEKHLFTANYFGGSISVLPILDNGTLGECTQVLEDQGTIGPTKATHAPEGSFAISGHDRTHAHMIDSDPSGSFVLHVDLALDQIFVSTFDTAMGKLKPHSMVSLPPGDGPRHFHFHPNGKWLYSIQEEGSTVVLFDFNARTGTLTSRQTISTLPATFSGSNFCSEILLSADGRFLYAGNRLLDSIAIFSVGDNGELTYVDQEWTRGNYPRSFAFDPSGQFLYCCNQRADNVTCFRVDAATGKLSFTDQWTPVGNPSHIVFLELPR